jgi:hypothetical protein
MERLTYYLLLDAKQRSVLDSFGSSTLGYAEDRALNYSKKTGRTVVLVAVVGEYKFEEGD